MEKNKSKNFVKPKKELIKKYKYYSKELKKLEKENKGKIPLLGTEQGNLIYQCNQAIKAIENLAEKQKIILPKK
jgi:hypothetical protein